MALKIGVLCSDGGFELITLLEAAESDSLPGRFCIVICDGPSSEALNIARTHGIEAAFVPRAAFHENRDGYERRLVDLLRAAGAEMAVAAGYDRQTGDVLNQAYPLVGHGLDAHELPAAVEKAVRKRLFNIVK